jgi:hypothetical protein
MNAPAALIALTAALAAQVPPPTSSVKTSEPFRVARLLAFEKEAKAIEALASRLDASGQQEAAAEVRRALPPAPPFDGSERFATIPEVVPARDPAAVNDAPSWRKELGAIRSETAAELFGVAIHATASEPRHYALADACLRAVVARQPDHREARRLLGQVPYHGGWATPFAVSQFKEGKVPHPVFGWVKASWVPHLVKGELPTLTGTGEGRERWVPAAEADALRKDFAHGWRITTEHFAIQTNVPLSEAIAFGHHLETLQEVFESLLADVLADRSALAQRFRNKTMVGERTSERHAVSYYATREDYGAAVSVFTDVDPAKSLGYYHPPQGRAARRGQAYFFRDEGGVLDATATLFHEASHQLLFESGVATATAFRNNAGNYWVFEGLGTYFETLMIARDGSVQIGGLVGPRNVEARQRLLRPGELTPLATFVPYDQNAFNRDSDIIRHYLQASAFATFLMNGEHGRYREGFLDYVRDACQSRLRRTSGRSLEARLEVTYPKLQEEFVAYLSARSR